MNHLLFKKSSNLPGIECFFFVPATSVLRDPLPGYDLKSDTLILKELPLKTGMAWYQATVSKHTLRYSGNSKLTASGREYKHTLSGVVAKVTAEVAATLRQFNEQPFVVIYLDRNGYLRLIGSKDYGLVFSFEEETGQGPGDRNQVSFQFSGYSKFPAYFYHGDLYNKLMQKQESDLGDVTVPARVLEDGMTIRILEA